MTYYKNSGSNKKNSFTRGFVHMGYLAIFIVVFMAIMFLGQDFFSSIVLLNFLITLGGTMTYADSVIGVAILFLLVGTVKIAFE